MTTARKHYTAQEKVTILRLHLLEHKPVSDLCDQYGLHPTLFYRWQKEFFENGHAAFEQAGRRRKAGTDATDRKIASLEGKLQQKNEVLAELMQEYVQLEKPRGFGCASAAMVHLRLVRETAKVDHGLFRPPVLWTAVHQIASPQNP